MASLFCSISVFRESMGYLCKKERHGYTSCQKDIASFFEGLTFDDIWEMHTRLRELGDFRLIKIRIQNSLQNLSSADGFRLIVCCNRKEKRICLLNIYPKRGKLAQLDQSSQEYKRQLAIYFDELKNKKLIDFPEKDSEKER